MPVPSISSFSYILKDFLPVPGCIPDRKAQTPQPLSAIPLAGNMWLPSLALLSQMDVLTGTFSGSSSPDPA